MMLKWLSAVAGLCYLAMGIAVIVYKFFIVVLEPVTAYALGGLFIVYGVFRLVRAIYKIRADRYEE